MTDTLPTKYFVVTGKGVSDTSEINAFDKALMNAGIENEAKELVKGSIANQNVVTVSSIIPLGCQRTLPISLPIGKITHCVLARMDGHKGQTVSAGIVLASLTSGHDIVAEGHDYVDKPFLQEYLCHKAAEMAEARNEHIKTKEGHIPHEKEWEEEKLRNLIDKLEQDFNCAHHEKELTDLLASNETNKEVLTLKLAGVYKELKAAPKQRRNILEGFAKDIKKLPKLYDKEIENYIGNGLDVKVATIREIGEDYGCTIAAVVFYD